MKEMKKFNVLKMKMITNYKKKKTLSMRQALPIDELRVIYV